METIKNKIFGQERALYGSKNLRLENVKFQGEEDGESALKECENIVFTGGRCDLRYPFWHVRGLEISDTVMTENCRAALWYCSGVKIENSALNGIKAVRECNGVKLVGCSISSPEFGWFSENITMEEDEIISEYLFLRSENIKLRSVRFTGKYSFQYVKNTVIEDCALNTKDAFWHSENTVVKNCDVNGEYLGWYSKNLTFINCRITGTQPLCYCKGLKLIDCTMEGCDLAFEKSETEAVVTSGIVSIKNPYSGRISVKSVGEVIRDDERSLCAIATGDGQTL